jgi:hypothetical protein
MRTRQTTLATLILFAVACGGDETPRKSPDSGIGANPAVSPDAYRKQQQAYADSVLNRVAPASQVAKELGAGYEVGSTRLRDSLMVLATKSGCFMKGRESDPYLAGTVTWYVYMSVVGSNVVRVQKSDWTSPAGNIVDSCLNLDSKNWKFDPSFGKPASYITQVQFK